LGEDYKGGRRFREWDLNQSGKDQSQLITVRTRTSKKGDLPKWLYDKKGENLSLKAWGKSKRKVRKETISIIVK